MAKSTATNKTLIDPVFGIPAGAEDAFVYTDETVFIGADQDSIAVEETTEAPGEEFDEQIPDVANVIDTPTDFKVLSQTLRRAPGGQQVVDIIIESEDVAGAVNYEFQVTKV